MNYKKISIACSDETSDILIALLGEINYEAFEQEQGVLYAYLPEHLFDETALHNITNDFHLTVATETIEKTNWNKKWEENFSPVIVENVCTIRADFHDIKINTPYEIVIHPKMSFGTGHHATTQLMMQAMSTLDFNQKEVLDFGTGTGILGILASYFGAKKITAIDNENWSCENAIENAKRNNVNNMTVVEGSLEMVTASFDIILANINRHILLQYMQALFGQLHKGGCLLISGIMAEDRVVMLNACEKTGFKKLSELEKNNWLQMTLTK